MDKKIIMFDDINFTAIKILLLLTYQHLTRFLRMKKSINTLLVTYAAIKR